MNVRCTWFRVAIGCAISYLINQLVTIFLKEFGKYCILWSYVSLPLVTHTLVGCWIYNTRSSLSQYFGNWILKTFASVTSMMGATFIVSMLMYFVNVVCTFGQIFVLTNFLLWVNNLNKFHSTIHPLLLLASASGLSLIFRLDIDAHLFFATQSRVLNTLKVEYDVTNSGILIAIDNSSFFLAGKLDWVDSLVFSLGNDKVFSMMA